MDTLKGLIIILDGLGDRPAQSLGNRTPLEAARTPHLDALAERGLCGQLHPLAPWVPVGTQLGVGLLMGLPPSEANRLQRGPVEAAGAGFTLRNSDLALRCNFATVRPNGTRLEIIDRRAGRIRTQREPLAEALNAMTLEDDVAFRFAPSTGHRAALVFSGEGLSEQITDTDPGAGYRQQGVLSCKPLHSDATLTARLVNAFVQKSHAVLHAHPVNEDRRRQGLPPANGILTRGAGRAALLHNQLAHLGVRVTLVTGERTTVGLARLFGFDVVHDPAFTGTASTDLRAKTQAVQDALTSHDLVYLHIKAPDVFAHDGNPDGKRLFLEQVDTALAPLLETEHVVAVTGDHSSDSTLMRHTGDPVPVCLTAPHSRKDAVRAYSETACIQGGLGHLSATALLYAVLDHMNRLSNYRPHTYLF